MKRILALILVFGMLAAMTACGKSAAETVSADPAAAEAAAEELRLNYGLIESDFSGLTPEIASAYLGIVDDLAAHLGCDEAEASEGECLYGGFVRDWDSDGTPELCLLLKTSPRESGSWDGTPAYGWYPPTLYLYTVRNGQVELAGNCDLYFATAGREAAVAALTAGDGLQLVRWDRSEFADSTEIYAYALSSGALQETDLPAAAAAASQGAETAQAYLDALGAGNAQLLLYNISGDAKLEGAANARELRAALAAKCS